MTLPHLVSYAAPRPFPRSRATWDLEPGRAAVLVHDLQQYFLRPFAPGCPAVDEMLAGTAAILRAARARGIPVVYTAQTGEAGSIVRGLQGDLWGAGMRPVPEHTDIVAAVAPADGDTVLVKHRYSAFAHSELSTLLASTGRDQLVVTGVYAHIGVLATTLDAFQREIQPFVVGDAVGDFSAEAHDRALAQVASCTGVVTTTSDVLARFAPEGGGFELALRQALAALLPGISVAAAFEDPVADLFTLGLDSMRAFDLLDSLADVGVEVDFGEFTRSANVDFLRSAALVSR